MARGIGGLLTLYGFVADIVWGNYVWAFADAIIPFVGLIRGILVIANHGWIF